MLCLYSGLIFAKAEIITIEGIKEAAAIISKSTAEQDLLIFDIHNLILMQKSNLLRPCGQAMLDDFFKRYASDPSKKWEMEKAILHERDELPVNTETIELINKLILNKQNLIFLSSYPIEKHSLDPNIEAYRFNQLLDSGIMLHDSVFNRRYNMENIKEKSYAFYNNIVFCENDSKGLAFDGVIEQSKCRPRHVYFIDDRLKNLQHVMQICVRLGIDFTGFYYPYAQSIPCHLDYEIASKQLEELATSSKWHEEDRV